MKRLMCILLACILLCACTAAPALREGYYLAPLAESNGSPMYFCLEPGGTGYVHAVGQDVQITWTPEGLGGDFSDGIVTENGIEFPDSVICTYSETLPEEYTQPVLRPGFYIPEEEDYASLLLYAELRSDGTGDMSIMGMTKSFEWEPTKFYFGDQIASATDEGFVILDTAPMNFIYAGDALPEDYLPDPPPAGTYYISSVSFEGNMSIHGTRSDSNCLVLNADGTGSLTFRGEHFALTWDGAVMALEGGYSLMLMYMPDQGADAPLLMAYAMDANCPIEADSIAFRLWEGE